MVGNLSNKYNLIKRKLLVAGCGVRDKPRRWEDEKLRR